LFKKILIANRGEIAVRIIRSCKNLGIKTVAIYSDVDEKSLHVKFADEGYLLADRRAYINIDAIIKAAKDTEADAIHPGYGFLAENEQFAQRCKNENITFIGPNAETIASIGVKTKARELMEKAGVPVVPGSKIIENVEEALKIAEEIGYPVLIKAAYGGGGRGIRAAYNSEELITSFNEAKKEATLAFGNGALYLEKFIDNPRHVEIQVIGDNYGNVVHLFERECSIQRRKQKLLEESPSPILTEELRQAMGEAAVRAAKAVDYSSAGTVECLVDHNLKFYFLEMNTRIQVEHPVTELTTGIDIVEEQIKVATGLKLSFLQKDVKSWGWAIECRINAEDFEKNFRPSTGIIKKFRPALGPWVRIDTYVEEGYKVTPFFDSMIAKLIVWGPTREHALKRMLVALDEFVIDGVKTTIPLFKELLKNKQFQLGNFDNNFLENWLEEEILNKRSESEIE